MEKIKLRFFERKMRRIYLFVESAQVIIEKLEFIEKDMAKVALSLELSEMQLHTIAQQELVRLSGDNRIVKLSEQITTTDLYNTYETAFDTIIEDEKTEDSLKSAEEQLERFRAKELARVQAELSQQEEEDRVQEAKKSLFGFKR